MSYDTLILRVATLGPIGYLIAPGTVATFITLPLVCLLTETIHSWLWYGIILLCCAVAAFYIISRSLKILKAHHDPQEIVLDELIGCMLLFWMIPLTAQSLIIGVILFRCLAVVKVGFIKDSQDLPGAWGVMGDDIVAALISNILLRFMF